MKPLVLATICLTLTACHKKDAPADKAPMPVDVAVATSDSLTVRKTFPATLKAAKEVDVVGRVNGTLLRQLYKDGDYVTKGTPLFLIESTSYANAVKAARADLDNARSAYAYASRNYEAMKRALERDAVARMEVLRAKSAMDEAQAQIRSASARLSDASVNLSYCTVRAPFSGYVSAAKLKQGAYVGGQAQPVVLATIYDNSSLSAEFAIDDADFISVFSDSAARSLCVDMKRIPVTFARPLGHSYTASLEYLAPDVDASTGTIVLKGVIQNPYNELRPGMYATISLPYAFLPKAVLVRDASISTDQRGKFLYMVNDSDRVVYTPVTVGELYHDSLRVVTAGISPGQRYVSTAILKVRPGDRVAPKIQTPPKRQGRD